MRPAREGRENARLGNTLAADTEAASMRPAREGRENATGQIDRAMLKELQ